VTRIQLIVAARNRRRAAEIAADHGLEPGEVHLIDGPWSLSQLSLQLPLYVDSSWPSHPRADAVATAVGERLRAVPGWPHWAGAQGS